MSDNQLLSDIAEQDNKRRFSYKLLRKSAVEGYALAMNTLGRESDPHFESLPLLPSWVTSTRAEATEYVAFLSGAALSHLHLVLADNTVPKTLIRDRLALRAAEGTVGFSGRSETMSDLRDALHFLSPGDLPGPAGEIYQLWRRSVQRPIHPSSFGAQHSIFSDEQIAVWFTQSDVSPIERAANVLEQCLDIAPANEASALILAEAVLAKALGWERITPVFTLGLKHSDLRARGERLVLACHHALRRAIVEIMRHVSDSTRNTIRVSAIVPKLRAKGAKDAVQIFLTQDAVAPSALPMPDRAARRLCDRLVNLGVVRELTGRDSFRLYGI